MVDIDKIREECTNDRKKTMKIQPNIMKEYNAKISSLIKADMKQIPIIMKQYTKSNQVLDSLNRMVAIIDNYKKNNITQLEKEEIELFLKDTTNDYISELEKLIKNDIIAVNSTKHEVLGKIKKDINDNPKIYENKDNIKTFFQKINI